MSLKYVNPDGQPQQQEYEPPRAENERVVRATAVVPYFTFILLGSIILVFLTQLATGLRASSGFADSNHELIRIGQYWRLVTGATMHADVTHILFNGMALLNLGRAIEYLSNRYHLAIVFFFAVLGGAVLSLFLLPNTISVGASGGIVGLLGYLAVYGYKRKKLLPPSFMQNMFINLALLIGVGVIGYQYIDNAAHFGGLAIGALYAFIQVPSDLHIDPRKSDGVTTALGYACLVAFLGFAVLTILLLTKTIAL